MAHNVATSPLVNEKITIFAILNQSDPNSQVGLTSKAMSKNVARKTILNAAKTDMVVGSRFTNPPSLRPTVSNTLKNVLLSRKNHEIPIAFFCMKL